MINNKDRVMYASYICEYIFHNENDYDEIELHNSIRKAIDTYEIGSSFHEELKQKISPLKLSLLMLTKYIEKKEKLSEGIQNAISSLEELEISVKRHFEEPNLIRYVKKIDILYIEDNELERKTINQFYQEFLFLSMN
ncbi:MAG: hypothetical protein Lokiarch_27940 [Candidatus Lokiarchaeum sp. GC14_75]|nr:MAG: hypothetical protein Lokiarch_27940 [Candidatus Lokiarchaeum sp. GC14_75]